MDYNEALSRIMDSLGLTLWGVTNAAQLEKYQGYYDRRPEETISVFEGKEQERRCLTEGNFIVVAFPYAHGLSFPKNHFSVYARGRDYHGIVNGYLERIAQGIQRLGFTAQTFCDSNALPERLMASLAGLGDLGRNGLLITRQYGSFVFLGEVRTDLPLTIQSHHPEPWDYALCGDCRRCLAACPVAILGPDYVITGQCLSAVSQKKQNDEGELRLLKGRLFGCDTCQRVCPWNEDKAGLGLPEFKPLPYMEDPDLRELLQLDNGVFREKYRLSAAGWRGKSVLTKNAMIALWEEGALPQGLSFASPTLQALYAKLQEESGKAGENHDPSPR